MKILLVYPEHPDALYSYKEASSFFGAISALPPVGLLTVAAMLPHEWEKVAVDMNINELKDETIKWADYVFISGLTMLQRDPSKKLINRCKQFGIKTVAGGPLFSTEYENFKEVDYLVLNEAEVTLPVFLEDLEKGNPKHTYFARERADIHTTPNPLWELIDMRDYLHLSIQYSRGCPYDCEFCDITAVLGRKPRTKSKEQIISELDKMYDLGWRGLIFLVDDNFIGNTVKLKNEILPAIIKWREERRNPIRFVTQASINLVDDKALMNLMANAGFNNVFIGIETPNIESLIECGKKQNLNRDIVASVKTIHENGIMVFGTFVLGFDSDTPSVFEEMIQLIQESGIIVAQVAILTPLKGTRLYDRLKAEGRLLKEDPVVISLDADPTQNFITKMDKTELLEGFCEVVNTVYSPKVFYDRIKIFLENYKPVSEDSEIDYIKVLIVFTRIIIYIGILGQERFYFWKSVLWCLFNKPKHVPAIFFFSILDLNWRNIYSKMTKNILKQR